MGVQLDLFASPTPAPAPVVLHRSQPHPRLDHDLTGLGHVAWISHGGQVRVDRRAHGESDEAWSERALEIIQRWDDVRVYDATGACIWDNRDYPVPSGGAR